MEYLLLKQMAKKGKLQLEEHWRYGVKVESQVQ